jgi:hypothetical protein
MRFGVCARSDYTGGWRREGALPPAGARKIETQLPPVTSGVRDLTGQSFLILGL